MHARISGLGLNHLATRWAPTWAATPAAAKSTLSFTRVAVPGIMAIAGLFSGAAIAQDSNLARNLAATCSNCHGTNGVARGDMKSLAGVSADKIIAAVADYKSGAQPATIMHQIAKGYTDEQIRLIAAYFASKPAPK